MIQEISKKEIFYDYFENFDNEYYFTNHRGALFLDRDGVIIKDINYINDPADVEIEKGLINLLSNAHKYRWPVIIVTNQSGISRGFYSWKEFFEVNKKMIELIGKPNPIYSIYANSHIKLNSSNWRKPNPFMLKEAAKKFGIDLKKSILVGDRISDLQAGNRGGVGNLIHVETGHGKKEKEKILKSLDKDKYFCDSGSKSKITFLKNLEYFPINLLIENK